MRMKKRAEQKYRKRTIAASNIDNFVEIPQHQTLNA